MMGLLLKLIAKYETYLAIELQYNCCMEKLI